MFACCICYGVDDGVVPCDGVCNKHFHPSCVKRSGGVRQCADFTCRECSDIKPCHILRFLKLSSDKLNALAEGCDYVFNEVKSHSRNWKLFQDVYDDQRNLAESLEGIRVLVLDLQRDLSVQSDNTAACVRRVETFEQLLRDIQFSPLPAVSNSDVNSLERLEKGISQTKDGLSKCRKCLSEHSSKLDSLVLSIEKLVPANCAASVPPVSHASVSHASVQTTLAVDAVLSPSASSPEMAVSAPTMEGAVRSGSFNRRKAYRSKRRDESSSSLVPTCHLPDASSSGRRTDLHVGASAGLDKDRLSPVPECALSIRDSLRDVGLGVPDPCGGDIGGVTDIDVQRVAEVEVSVGSHSISSQQAPDICAAISSAGHNTLTGAGDAFGAVTLRPAVLPRSVFVSRVHPDTTVDDVVRHISSHFGVSQDGVNCQRIDKFRGGTGSFFASFKLVIPDALFDAIVSPEIWPNGTIVREFISRNHARSGSTSKNSSARLRSTTLM